MMFHRMYITSATTASDNEIPDEEAAMRPPIDDEAIEILREEVPEFELAYLDLLDIYDEDLTPEVVFMELADFVIGLLAVSSDDEDVERCFGAIELVATTVEDGRH